MEKRDRNVMLGILGISGISVLGSIGIAYAIGTTDYATKCPPAYKEMQNNVQTVLDLSPDKEVSIDPSDLRKNYIMATHCVANGVSFEGSESITPQTLEMFDTTNKYLSELNGEKESISDRLTQAQDRLEELLETKVNS